MLDYLEDQPSAVINGAAGTGKTMLAIEKARRHAAHGEKVLFLCYNSRLKEYLSSTHASEYVDYFTIDGLACKLCNTAQPDHEALKYKLESMYGENIFKYRHVIIDEGQDFGQERIEDTNIIKLLEQLVMDDEQNRGTFYIFYDRNQMIQSFKTPSYISEADCRLTLYRNCRNTKNIASTSVKILPFEVKLKLADGCVNGDQPGICFPISADDCWRKLEERVEIYKKMHAESIVVLTCKTEETSILSNHNKGGFFSISRDKILFTTCRKFKGLEADAIIMIDVDEQLWNEYNSQLFYVGASRARFYLNIFCSMTKEACEALIDSKRIPTRSKNPYRSFALALNAVDI